MISLDYLAGWLDGDGHIGLKQGRQHTLRAFVNIRNTDLEVVTEIRDYIADRFGVAHGINCNIPKLPPGMERPRKPLYYFAIQRKELLFELLSLLNGRCIVRAEIIARALYETYERVGRAKPRKNPLRYRKVMTWPYVSGFFDSEGNVRPRGQGRSISLSNNCAAVLLMIQEFIDLGGYTKRQNRKMAESNPQWRPSFRLRYRQAESLAVCEQLLPHCITKRDAIADILDTERLGLLSREILHHDRSTPSNCE